METFEILFIDRPKPVFVKAKLYEFIGEEYQIVCFYDNSNKTLAHLPAANILYISRTGLVKTQITD